MPQITVPLTRAPTPRPPPPVSISYRMLGSGPVLVLMVPGLCVPASMYDAMAAVLAATTQFTAVVLDNRGMGLSAAPPAALLGGPGYTVSDLAADAWAVVDHVISATRPPAPPPAPAQARLHAEVALVGHSMGGMVVQQMLAQRPTRVRFAALLSTHAGGLWNLVPTTRMLRSILRVAWSGFDRDVHAAVNLSMHFTHRFLDAWVVPDIDLHADWCSFDPFHLAPDRPGKELDKHQGDEQGERPGSRLPDEQAGKEAGEATGEETGEDTGEDAAEDAGENDTEMLTTTGEEAGEDAADDAGENDTEMLTTSTAGVKDTTPDPSARDDENRADRSESEAESCRDSGKPDTDPLLRAMSTGGVGYLESKVVELVRDAQVYFGFTKSFRESLWKPQRLLLEAIAKRRRRARRRRREIYHARYTGAEGGESSTESGRSGAGEGSSSSLTTNPEDSPHALYGHAAVVRSHALSRAVAARLRECSRVVKLVMSGRHDRVVTPASSRALARAIGADTVVEVEAAHFITDEAAAEVTTHVIYGLRKAFFARRAEPCECGWCVEGEGGCETGVPACRMC